MISLLVIFKSPTTHHLHTHLKWNVTPHIRRGSHSFLLKHFIAPSLNLIPCLSTWLEIIVCSHSWGMREAIRAVISRREDKQGINSLPRAGFEPGSELDGCLWRLPSYRSNHSATMAGFWVILIGVWWFCCAYAAIISFI